MISHVSEITSNTRTQLRKSTMRTSSYSRTDIIGNLKHKIILLVEENNLNSILNIDTNFLLETIDDLVNERNLKLKAQCLNPSCFILGYSVLKIFKNDDDNTSKKKKYIIDLKKLEEIKTKLKVLLHNEKIEIEDIIRYARYWATFIFKSQVVLHNTTT